MLFAEMQQNVQDCKEIEKNGRFHVEKQQKQPG